MAQRTLEGRDGNLPSTVQGFPHTPTHRPIQPDELLLTAGAADDSHYASDGLTLPSTPPTPPSPLWMSILICICYGNCSHGWVQRGSGPPVSLLFVSGKVNEVFIFTHWLCPGHRDVAASPLPADLN